MTDTNPLLGAWDAPFGAPPFAAVKTEHFAPALTEGMKAHTAEIDAITANADAPTFENTIIALEKTGALLDRANHVMNVLSGVCATPELQAVEMEMSPALTAHMNEFYQNEALFKRIDAVFDNRAGLAPVAQRLIERIHHYFVESGAKLSPEKKARVAAINIRLSELQLQFQQNELAEQQDFELKLETEADRAGLSPATIAAAIEAGNARGYKDTPVITLSASSRGAFMKFSTRRDLREKVWRANRALGDRDNATDNKKILLEIVRLRAELAQLMGYATFADYRTNDMMAKTPETVTGFLDGLWQRARKAALREADQMSELAEASGQNEKLAAWDLAFYGEKLRQKLCDLNEDEIRQYLTLDRVIAGMFHTASTLFGLTFAERTDLPTWHPDVRTWEVKDRNGNHVSLFYGDFFARALKSDGAWMSSIRNYNAITGETPIIYNICNFNKPAAGEPCLLSVLELETVFHEFGHALHAMLTRAPFPTLAGTNVLWDFVELPSQLFEHWALSDEILSRFALHHKTGEPMPAALRQRLRAAKSFNRGFDMAGYLSAAQLDMAWHALTPEQAATIDVHAFEAELRDKLQMPDLVHTRPPSTGFGHIFTGSYASGYYSYVWAQVLDADAFEAFRESGDVFNPAIGQRLHDYVYSAGNSEDPAVLYEKFRGRPATIDALLKQLGFTDEPAVQKAG